MFFSIYEVHTLYLSAQMQHSLAQSRQRQNSLPKATTSAMQNPGTNGPFLVPGSGALPIPGVKVEPTTGGQRITANGGSEDQEQNKEMHKLVAAIQRYAYLIMLTCKLFSATRLICFFSTPGLKLFFDRCAAFTSNVIE